MPNLKEMMTKDKLKINGFFSIKKIQVASTDKFKFIDLDILLTAPSEWDTYAK